MADKKTQFVIVSGPSKFDLMTALFVGDTESQLRVTFGLGTADAPKVPRCTIDVRILGVERESGCGESWNIHGYATSFDGSQEARIEGHYSTKRRNGHLTLTR